MQKKTLGGEGGEGRGKFEVEITNVVRWYEKHSETIFIRIHPIVLYYNEYEWCATVKHNTLIFPILCYMFQFNKTLSGITSKQFGKT